MTLDDGGRDGNRKHPPASGVRFFEPGEVVRGGVVENGGAMSARFYFVVSGAVFASIAIVHCIRLVEGWTVQVGPWVAPMWVSGLGVAITLALAAWAFTLAALSGK